MGATGADAFDAAVFGQCADGTRGGIDWRDEESMRVAARLWREGGRDRILSASAVTAGDLGGRGQRGRGVGGIAGGGKRGGGGVHNRRGGGTFHRALDVGGGEEHSAGGVEEIEGGRGEDVGARVWGVDGGGRGDYSE